jgi:hypothetical protein
VKDEQLDEALRRLPPTAASAGFTDAVVARVGAGRARRLPRLLAPLALAVAVAALVFALRPDRAVPDAAAELEALRREQRQVARELAALRASLAPPPVLYLGTSAGIDLVLDVTRHESRPRPGQEVRTDEP